MKRSRIWASLLAVCLLLAGCQDMAVTNPTPEPPEQPTTQKPAADRSVQFQAQYIRTNGGLDGYHFPNCVVIGDPQALDAYYHDNSDVFDLARKQDLYQDDTIGFLDACDGFDETFFVDNYLLLIVLEEGSGSITHRVNKVVQTPQEELQIQIETTVPEICTADMAQWHIVLALPRDGALPDAQNIFVYLYEKLIWNGSPVSDPVPPELQPEILTQPPDGRLLYPDGEIQLAKGGFSWTYRQEDGSETTICADQALRFPTTLPLVPVTGFCKLDFTAAPKEVSVICRQTDVETAEELFVPVQEDSGFTPIPGDRIYEITATWDNGTVQYYVRLELVSFISYGMGMRMQLQDESELEAMLQNLTYQKGKVCKCRPQYYLITEDGTRYGVHLGERYIRCDLGQAKLTQEQYSQVSTYIMAQCDKENAV